jgi:hypothetical protein
MEQNGIHNAWLASLVPSVVHAQLVLTNMVIHTEDAYHVKTNLQKIHIIRKEESKLLIVLINVTRDLSYPVSIQIA